MTERLTTPRLRICSACGRSWTPRNMRTRKGKCDFCGETPKNQIHNGEFAVPWRMDTRSRTGFRRRKLSIFSTRTLAIHSITTIL